MIDVTIHDMTYHALRKWIADRQVFAKTKNGSKIAAFPEKYNEETVNTILECCNALDKIASSINRTRNTNISLENNNDICVSFESGYFDILDVDDEWHFVLDNTKELDIDFVNEDYFRFKFVFQSVWEG